MLAFAGKNYGAHVGIVNRLSKRLQQFHPHFGRNRIALLRGRQRQDRGAPIMFNFD
jgi:hypothetical protein